MRDACSASCFFIFRRHSDIFLLCGKASTDMTFLLVYFKYLPDLFIKLRCDMLQPFAYILMHCTFAYPEFSSRRTDSCLVFDDVLSEHDCPFIRMFSQNYPPFSIMRSLIYMPHFVGKFKSQIITPNRTTAYNIGNTAQSPPDGFAWCCLYEIVPIRYVQSSMRTGSERKRRAVCRKAVEDDYVRNCRCYQFC